MAILSAANLGTLLDDVCLAYVKLVGTSGSGYGLSEPNGGFGSAYYADALSTLIAGIGDIDVASDLAPAVSRFESELSSLSYFGSKVAGLLGRMAYHAQQRGSYASVDAWLKFLNVDDATKWQALAPTQWRDIYYQVKGVYPGAYNVYQEILQGSTYTNALRKSVVTGAGTDTETAGTSVDSTKYCGGTAKLLVSGLTGTGTVTITGTAFDPATETTTTGVTWTASVTANGTVACSVGSAPANSLIVACSAVTIPAGISAGTIYVEAHRPTGRALVS